MQDDPRDIPMDGETTSGKPEVVSVSVVVKPSRARTKAVAPVPPVKPAPRAPFRMSYDGTTDKDYIAHIIRLGAR